MSKQIELQDDVQNVQVVNQDESLTSLMIAYASGEPGTASHAAITEKLRNYCVDRIASAEDVLPNMVILRVLDQDENAAHAFMSAAIGIMCNTTVMQGDNQVSLTMADTGVDAVIGGTEDFFVVGTNDQGEVINKPRSESTLEEALYSIRFTIQEAIMMVESFK